MKNAFLLPRQADNDGRHQALGDHALFVELFHQALVFHLLMGGMLVNDEQLILELDQPVGIEDLSDDPVTAAVLHGQQFFLE